ncbi:HIT-like domain-containing protein [Glomus cerebriforme]|uniref:HIT-like domain-containing protein n=1 Tax=Glomus cerebriforme TaxID=658196 RepID=A0A397TKI6_9GLOM|nr:HIT-like domain-containing protein [Glomus cerebriforme]
MSSDDINDHDHEQESNQCTFCAISSERDFTSLLYVDENVVAFNDIKPAATHHVLVVPKKHIPNVNSLKNDDLETVKKMKEVGLQIISRRLHESVDDLQKNYQDKKERTYQIGFVSPPFNSINHIHMHVLSKPIKTWWPRSLGFGRFIFKDIDDVINKIENSQ